MLTTNYFNLHLSEQNPVRKTLEEELNDSKIKHGLSTVKKMFSWVVFFLKFYEKFNLKHNLNYL